MVYTIKVVDRYILENEEDTHISKILKKLSSKWDLGNRKQDRSEPKKNVLP